MAAPLARELLAPIPATAFCCPTLRLNVSCHEERITFVLLIIYRLKIFLQTHDILKMKGNVNETTQRLFSDSLAALLLGVLTCTASHWAAAERARPGCWSQLFSN